MPARAGRWGEQQYAQSDGERAAKGQFMFNNDDILAALAKVPGPDGKTPLPQSGAVSGISIREGKVFLSIAVTPEQAPHSQPIRLAAEEALKAMPGVKGAVVVLTSERAPGSAPQQAAPKGGSGHAHAAHGAAQGAGVEGIKKIIAVASGKGGVGKSTTSANLAIGLARMGLKVGLLDADLFGPSQPRLFGISGRPDMEEGGALKPIEKFGVKVMSIGFLVPDDAAIVWRGPMVMSALTQLLRDVAWGELDVLVVDMPPGTGDTQLTMAQNVGLAGAVIVSTPQDLALIDARRGIAMFNQVHVPIYGLFENMSYFLCPHCGERTDIFSHGGAKAEAEKMDVPFLGEAPLDASVRETSDAGLPVVAKDPDSPQAKPYLVLAEKVRDAMNQAPAKKAPKIAVE
jgi:ATP-binding protein involved in chromosome partitioning